MSVIVQLPIYTLCPLVGNPFTHYNGMPCASLMINRVEIWANGRILKNLFLYTYLAHSQLLLYCDQDYINNCLKTLTGFAKDTSDADSVGPLNTGATYRYLKIINY